MSAYVMRVDHPQEAEPAIDAICEATETMSKALASATALFARERLLPDGLAQQHNATPDQRRI